MLNLILFGPPGSGKGTQSAKLIEKYNLEHISTGDLLREQIAKETPLGLKAKKYMEKGLLVPDEVVIGMIASKLEEKAGCVKGFIFDGFPRTVAQAEALDLLLTDRALTISRLVALDVPEEELVQRLLKRGETSGRADDRNEETIRQRVQVYENKTALVAGHYEQQSKFSKVEGVGSIDEIFDRLANVVDSLTQTAEEE